MVKVNDKAQAYALRVWEGQSHTVPRAERIARVRQAVEGQGLSMAGVELPETGPDWQEQPARGLSHPEAVHGDDSEVSDALAYAVEKWANGGTLLDWNYWLLTLRRLTRAQAARLLNGLHPRNYADLRADPGIREYDTRQARETASDMEEAAEDHGMDSATAQEWLDWAHRYFPGRFRSRFAERLAEVAPSSEQSAVPAADARGGANPVLPGAGQLVSGARPPSVPTGMPMAGESKKEQAARRYDRYRELGGAFDQDDHGDWRLSGSAFDTLRQEEVEAGRPNTSEKTIRKQLKKEHDCRTEVSREGAAANTPFGATQQYWRGRQR